jgi:hypothetical protein
MAVAVATPLSRGLGDMLEPRYIVRAGALDQ